MVMEGVYIVLISIFGERSFSELRRLVTWHAMIPIVIPEVMIFHQLYIQTRREVVGVSSLRDLLP